MNDVYFDTLSETLDAVERFAAKERAVLHTDWKECFAVNYCLYAGQSARESFELLSLRGKPTRKYLHMSLYRLDSGRYELTVYIL